MFWSLSWLAVDHKKLGSSKRVVTLLQQLLHHLYHRVLYYLYIIVVNRTVVYKFVRDFLNQ